MTHLILGMHYLSTSLFYDNDSKYDRSRVRDFIMFVEGIDFEYYLHGHDGLYLTKKELLEKMRGALNG